MMALSISTWEITVHKAQETYNFHKGGKKDKFHEVNFKNLWQPCTQNGLDQNFYKACTFCLSKEKTGLGKKQQTEETRF